MRQETIRHLRDRQSNQVRVIDKECLDKDGNSCVHNATSECFECIVFSGDTSFPGKFTASWKTDDIERVSNLTTEELTKPIESPKETKVVDDDIPHFVKFIQLVITHQHSGSFDVHKHYECHRIGDNCIFCGRPVIGKTICEQCETYFNGVEPSGNSLHIGDDGTLVYDALNRKFLFL